MSMPLLLQFSRFFDTFFLVLSLHVLVSLLFFSKLHNCCSHRANVYNRLLPLVGFPTIIPFYKVIRHAAKRVLSNDVSEII